VAKDELRNLSNCLESKHFTILLLAVLSCFK
jgi:hypothetical protein